jgi:hypothetical protein
MSQDEIILRKLRRSIGLITLLCPLVGACGGALGAFWLGRQDIADAVRTAHETQTELRVHEENQLKDEAKTASRDAEIRDISNRVKRIEMVLDSRLRL